MHVRASVVLEALFRGTIGLNTIARAVFDRCKEVETPYPPEMRMAGGAV
jgi:hypothetical protein